METVLPPFVDAFPFADTLGRDSDVEAIVRRALAIRQHPSQRLERRKDARFPYPFPLTIMPLEQALRSNPQGHTAGIGKHLTLRGIDFYSAKPIVATEVICQFHSPPYSPALVLELTWCRHNAQGWFENGGRFLRVWKSAANYTTERGKPSAAELAL